MRRRESGKLKLVCMGAWRSRKGSSVNDLYCSTSERTAAGEGFCKGVGGVCDPMDADSCPAGHACQPDRGAVNTSASEVPGGPRARPPGRGVRRGSDVRPRHGLVSQCEAYKPTGATCQLRTGECNTATSTCIWNPPNGGYTCVPRRVGRQLRRVLRPALLRRGRFLRAHRLVDLRVRTRQEARRSVQRHDGALRRGRVPAEPHRGPARVRAAARGRHAVPRRSRVLVARLPLPRPHARHPHVRAVDGRRVVRHKLPPAEHHVLSAGDVLQNGLAGRRGRPGRSGELRPANCCGRSAHPRGRRHQRLRPRTDLSRRHVRDERDRDRRRQRDLRDLPRLRGRCLLRQSPLPPAARGRRDLHRRARRWVRRGARVHGRRLHACGHAERTGRRVRPEPRRRHAVQRGARVLLPWRGRGERLRPRGAARKAVRCEDDLRRALDVHLGNRHAETSCRGELRRRRGL